MRNKVEKARLRGKIKKSVKSAPLKAIFIIEKIIIATTLIMITLKLYNVEINI